MDWYLKVLKQYADFSGRARRKEYWMFMLFHLIIIFLLSFLLGFSSNDFGDDSGPSPIVIGVLGIYFLATLIPSIAVTVRRLHDIGKSGWFYLLNFIPYIGGFIVLIFTCMDSENKTNQWGNNPKGIGNDSNIDLIGKE
ncbi:DUF805 domain-containing protein [Polaribacter aquimarinus]|uniref:DUF805 domain-containing protein n=1 Tax=Polaribacter aquimarinus TaxID=2100726 RepID=A0A2U2J7U9_9FLAO|nr:DUF805 domain-containing protein [Polaribacter aquimarinus]PWG04415.1 DUF805 domain-containing protein [Polaribacter aquimarinus]